MSPAARRRAAVVAAAALVLGACAMLGRAPGGDGRIAESSDHVVVAARPGDTTAELARRFLGDPGLAWMIEDYNDLATPRPARWS